jgi:hypothetical protein
LLSFGSLNAFRRVCMDLGFRRRSHGGPDWPSSANFTSTVNYSAVSNLGYKFGLSFPHKSFY